MPSFEIGGIAYTEMSVGKNKKPILVFSDVLKLSYGKEGIKPYRDRFDSPDLITWVDVKRRVANRNFKERLMNNEEWVAIPKDRMYTKSYSVVECLDTLVNFSGKYPVLWENPEIETVDGYRYKLKRGSGKKKTVKWLPRVGRFEYYKIVRFDEDTLLPVEVELDPARVSIGDACSSPSVIELELIKRRLRQEYNKPALGSYVSAEKDVVCLVRKGPGIDLTDGVQDFLGDRIWGPPGFRLVIPDE